MSAPIVSFDVVTFHARGAWPRFDGFEMTHSADGVATLADGSTVQFTATRHVKAGSPTETVATLYSAARRELTAARWEELRGMIRRAFTGHVRDMADGPRPASIKPGTVAPGASLPTVPADAGDVVTVDGIESGATGPDWEPDAQSLFYAQNVETPALMAFGPSRAAALATLANGGAEPVTRGPSHGLADALAIVTGRSVDGAEYLTAHGMSGDRRAALVMPWADAVAIAASEESKAAATRSPDCGVYGIKAAPYGGPSLYTLADYQTDEREGAALDALYGADA